MSSTRLVARLALASLVAIHGSVHAQDLRPVQPGEAAGAPELVVQRGHSAGILCLAFAPDSRTVVTGPGASPFPSMDVNPRVWDLHSGREIRRMETTHQTPVNALAVSEDGLWVVSGDNAGEVVLCELATGKQRMSFSTGIPTYAVGVNEGARAVVAVGIVFEETAEGAFYIEGVASVYSGATGELVNRFELGALSVFGRSVSLSPDGYWLATAGSDGVARVWDVEDGDTTAEFDVGSQSFTLALTHDGQQMVTGDEQGRLAFWDEDGLQHEQRIAGAVNVLLASPTAELVLAPTADGSGTHVFDAETGEDIGPVPGVPFGVTPDNELVLTSPYSRHAELANHTLEVRDVEEGELITVLRGFVSPVLCVTLTADGTGLATGDLDGNACIWNLEEGQEVARRKLPGQLFTLQLSTDGEVLLGASVIDPTPSDPQPQPPYGFAVARTSDGGVLFERASSLACLSGDGRRVAYWATATGIEVVELATGQALWSFECAGAPQSLAFSQDGARLAVGDASGRARVMDVEARRELYTAAGGWVDLDGAGNKLVTMDGIDVVVHDLAAGAPVGQYGGRLGEISADGGTLAVTVQAQLAVYDTATGEQVCVGKGHLDYVNQIAIAPDGSTVWTACKDGSLRVFDREGGWALAQLLSFDEQGSWAVVDRDGRYDAAYGGEVIGLHCVFHDQGVDTVVPMQQLKDAFYEPRLLPRLLAGRDGELEEVADLWGGEVSLFPDVEITHLPDERDAVLRATVRNRGGGIGPVAVLVNGKEVSTDARPSGADQDAKTLQIALDLKDSPLFVAGRENVFEVVPYNKDETASGRGGFVKKKKHAGPADTSPTRVWAVIAGVSRYAGEGIRLKFASKDAAAIAKAVEHAAKRTHGAPNVDVQLLHDEGKPATRANLLAALGKLKQAGPNDVLFVYLAGHGVTEGKKDEADYFYLTQEAEELDLSNRAQRDQWAVSSADITELIKSTPASKEVLILDTCAAGQLISDLAGSRGAPPNRTRALEDLKDRTGMFVLAGSAADAKSYESSSYGQGLLTYSLLLGMTGPGMKTRPFIDVGRLLDFAQERVPTLAEDIRAKQRPELMMPRGSQSFTLGELGEEDQGVIQLAQKRPIVVRSRFELADEPFDALKLSRAVNEAMDAHSSNIQLARFLFLDEASSESAYAVRGRYTLSGDAVTVQVWVRRGDALAKRFEVKGKKGELADLTKAILRELVGSFG